MLSKFRHVYSLHHSKISGLNLCSESDLTPCMRKHIYNSFIKIIFTISIIGIFIFPTTVCADTLNPHIGDDDTYEKNVSIEKSVCFNWTYWKKKKIHYQMNKKNK